jgi:hypothetical protein
MTSHAPPRGASNKPPGRVRLALPAGFVANESSFIFWRFGYTAYIRMRTLKMCRSLAGQCTAALDPLLPAGIQPPNLGIVIHK